MSVRAVARVWELSTAKGGDLLVLLAIADYAEDDGRNAWPTVGKLATKSRITERGARKILRRLERLGELAIEKNVEGRRVLAGHQPRAFMHVLCCTTDTEQSSGVAPLTRNKVPVQTGTEFRRKLGARGTIGYDEPEQSGTRIRKIRQDPSVRTSTGAPRRDPPRPVEISNPSSLDATVGTFGLYCTIAREARQRSNDVDQSDQIGNIAEWFKTFCAQRLIQYDSEIVTKAIEAVMKADEHEAAWRHG